MFKIFQKAPNLDAVADMTGAQWGMSHLVDMLQHNKTLPKVGDVIAQLESCSMGVSVRRDTRWRVTGPGTYPNSVIAEDAQGNTKHFYPHYMRRHTEVDRFWLEFN